MLILLPVSLALGILVGASGISVQDWNTSVGRAIFWLRVNRVISAFVVGAGLSCAGVVLQALLRNPLADPYVLGVSGGAALGAALAIYFGFSSVWIMALPLSAFTGAVITLTIVYFLTHRNGSSSVYGLLLSGVIVSSMCSSMVMLIISIAPVEGLHSITWWMLGSLQVLSVRLLRISAVLIIASVAGIWLMARNFDALTLGREMAHHLGIRTGLIVFLGLVLATLATAASVAIAGLIGFVGLIVPHMMRGLVGPGHRTLVPVSALAGGIFLILGDTAARTVLAPIEIPVGVVTALIGGPFFLILLVKRRKHGWIE